MLGGLPVQEASGAWPRLPPVQVSGPEFEEASEMARPDGAELDLAYLLWISKPMV